MASELLAVGVVVLDARRGWVWELDVCDLEVVGRAARGVRADEETVSAKCFARYVLDIR